MPKARTKPTKKTKGKNVLSRGRQKKEVSSSGTEDNISERPASHNGETSQHFLESSAASGDSGLAGLKPLKESKSKEVQIVATVTEGSETVREPWEDIPDLVAELKSSQPISYVTNDLRHREFELNARKELLMLHEQLELLKDTAKATLKAVRHFCPDVKYGKISDATRFPEVSTTLSDLILKLINQSNSGYPASVAPKIVREPLFEISEEEDEDDHFTKTSRDNILANFPSPASMRKHATPKQQLGIFQFGTQGRGTVLSTNKAPRLAKPGEVVYSEGGSPILPRRIPPMPDGGPAKPHERLEVFNVDGSKIEVDLVYRDVPSDANKIRGFKEFAKGVRDIATRSTVNKNRIMPPRIGQSQKVTPAATSASKKKPDWR